MNAQSSVGAAKAVSADIYLRPDEALTRPNSRSWPALRIERLIDLHNRNWSFGGIALELHVSRGAVASQIARLKRVGDRRLQENHEPLDHRLLKVGAIDRLAEAFARGAKSLHQAANWADLSYLRAEILWAEIKRQLGPQAV